MAIKRMALFGIGGGTASGERVLRVGKIWQVANYPEHGVVDASVDKARAGNSEFKPRRMNSAHNRSVFDRLPGGLGDLSAVTIRDDGEVIGAIDCPRWLDELFKGKDLPVSAEVDTETLEIIGLAFEDNPALTDAKVMAAFTAANPPIQKPKKKEGKMKWKDFVALFAKAEIPEGGSIDDVEIDLPTDDQSARLRTELAAEKAKTVAAETAVADFAKRERDREKDLLNASAEAFADDLIVKKKAYPGEREHLIGEFTDAVSDDAAEKQVALFTAGKPTEGRRVERLRKHYSDKAEHGQTIVQSEGKFAVVGADTGAGGGSKMSATRKSELMASSTLGRTVIARQAKTGGN